MNKKHGEIVMIDIPCFLAVLAEVCPSKTEYIYQEIAELYRKTERALQDTNIMLCTMDSKELDDAIHCFSEFFSELDGIYYIEAEAGDMGSAKEEVPATALETLKEAIDSCIDPMLDT